MSKKLQFSLDFEQDLEKYLKSKIQNLLDFRILSESLDARGASRGKRPKVHYHIEYICLGGEFSSPEEIYPDLGPLNNTPLIIGAGPAGLFCALRLLEYGVPSLIFERGEEWRMIRRMR